MSREILLLVLNTPIWPLVIIKYANSPTTTRCRIRKDKSLGSVWVEVLKDVSFRIVPLPHRDAQEMIKEIKGYRLLEGYRGSEPANITVLEDLLHKISDFMEKIPAMDLNPIFDYKDGAIAVDARIVLEEKAS
jgi:acyl-CoA synthetase (NDP forming)